MVYPTVKATVQQGQIKFLDDVELPENSTLLITVLDYGTLNTFTLGEHLISGLEDIVAGRITETTTTSELTHHLDTVFAEA